MKSRTKINLIVLALYVGTAFSCATDKNQSQEVANVVAGYLEVKDALVKTDPEAASMASSTLASLSGSLEGDNWGTVHQLASEMAKQSDVKRQREAFQKLSEEIYNKVKESGSEATLYKQYCPMAFDNTGAYWLAGEKEINNPYFGDMMLRCGRVEEEL